MGEPNSVVYLDGVAIGDVPFDLVLGNSYAELPISTDVASRLTVGGPVHIDAGDRESANSR